VRLLLAILPAAACAAAMFLCFRMMSHSKTPTADAAEDRDIEALRDEVARLREELGRPDPTTVAADGVPRTRRLRIARTAARHVAPGPSFPEGTAADGRRGG
jgi:hypothetical protein